MVIRRLASPLALVIGSVVIFTIVFNAVLYIKVSPERSIFKSGKSSSANTKGDSKLSADILNSDDFSRETMEKLKAAKQKEILEKLEEDIRKTNEENIKHHLKKVMTHEIGDKVKSEVEEEIRSKVKEEFTNRIFDEQVVDMTMFESLKAKYINDHADQLKDSSVLEKVKEIIDKNPKVSSHQLDEQFGEKVGKKNNKKEYLQHIVDLLIEHAPTVEKMTNEERGRDIDAYLKRHVRADPYSKEYLLNDHVKLSDEKIRNLKEKHSELVNILKNLEEPSHKYFSGSGIVVSGGGSYFSNALVVIGHLREMGSRLPIELILNSRSEYDSQICEELLPKKLNGKCIIIEDELGSDILRKLDLKPFQLKTLGLLVSSFDNIILLDADNFPTKDVDQLVAEEPFLSSKWLMWPDIWARATSPHLYDIIGIEVGEPVDRLGIANDWDYHDYIKKDKNKDIAYHDFENIPSTQSVETGQMVFSKRLHYKSFLLALYYNIYGYDFYYRLMFQGTPGEGDRETFIHALHVFNEPYHLSNHDVWLAGYREGEKQDGGFQETTIVQYDPQESFKFYKDWRRWLREKDMDTRLWPFQDNPYTNDLRGKFLEENKKVEPTYNERGVETTKEVPYKMPGILFLHIHKPKIDPVKSAGDNFDIYSRRNLGLPNAYKEHFGTIDWELKIHSVSKWVACKAITSEKFWKEVAKKEQSEVCDKATKYVDFLKKDSQDLDAEKLNYLDN